MQDEERSYHYVRGTAQSLNIPVYTVTYPKNYPLNDLPTRETILKPHAFLFIVNLDLNLYFT